MANWTCTDSSFNIYWSEQFTKVRPSILGIWSDALLDMDEDWAWYYKWEDKDWYPTEGAKWCQ